jgi:hypothetical protein
MLLENALGIFVNSGVPAEAERVSALL